MFFEGADGAVAFHHRLKDFRIRFSGIDPSAAFVVLHKPDHVHRCHRDRRSVIVLVIYAVDISAEDLHEISAYPNFALTAFPGFNISFTLSENFLASRS